MVAQNIQHRLLQTVATLLVLLPLALPFTAQAAPPPGISAASSVALRSTSSAPPAATTHQPLSPSLATLTPPFRPAALLADTNGDADCTSGPGFTWLVCGIILNVVDGVDWTRDNIIVPFLQETPLDTKNLAYPIWQTFRNVANVFLILIFFLVIFGTAVGYDNYTLKRTLPKLVAATLFIQISWPISAAITDTGNIMGQGIVALVNSINLPKPTIDFTGGNFSTKTLFIGGALVGVGASTGVLGLSLSTVVSLALALLAVFFTLAFRRVLMLLLAVFSALAFLLWILPNTEKFFKLWLNTLIKLSLMYPLIMACFMGGRIFASVAQGAYNSGAASDQTAVPLFQLAGYIVPLLAIPFTLSFAGKGMSAGANGINKLAGAVDNKWGKNSQSAKDRAENRQANNAMKAFDPNAKFGAVGRAVARKRGGLGPMINASGVPVLGKLPGLHQTTAQQNRGINARNSAINAKAQVQGIKDFDKENGGARSTKDLVALRTEAKKDELLDSRVREASLQLKLDGVSIKDVDLTADSIDASGAKVMGNISLLTDMVKNGDTATKIAAMQSLSRSESGYDALDKVRVSNFGGTDTQNVDTEFKTAWAKGTAGAKSPDAKKPIAAAYADVSAQEFAGMSKAQVNRAMAYYERRLVAPTAELQSARLSGDATRIATAEADYATARRPIDQFNTAVKTAAGNDNIAGKVQPETWAAIQAASAGGGASIGADTAQAVANYTAKTAPPPPQVVSSNISGQITQSATAAAKAGGAPMSVDHLAAIQGAIAADPALQNTLEQQILNGQPLGLSNLPANLQTAPIGPSMMPEAVQQRIIRDHGTNLNNLAAIQRAYTADPAFRATVHDAVANNNKVPLPRQS